MVPVVFIELQMKRLLFAIILLPINLIAQYNWQALANAPKSWREDDMYFLNSNMGWVTHAQYDYISPNQYGQIYQTRDGGNTWQLLKDSAKTFYRSIGFADSLTGWVGNLADTNKYWTTVTQDTIPMYQTTDGGKTWSPVNLPYPHPVGICGISVVSDSVVYAYGRWNSKWNNNNVGYIKTIDKGKTWTYYDMSLYCFGMVDGWFFNKDTGFITGASPTYKAQILSTTDGGNTWQVCYRSTRADSDEVWKIFFPSRDTGYGAIEYQNSTQTNVKRYLVKTVDGGKTWKEYPFIDYYDEEGIGFINDTIGWIGGDNQLSTYITFDGGNTWNTDYNFGTNTPPYQGSTGFSINRFRKINDTLMYACGNTVYELSGTVTGIKNISTSALKTTNFPNPYTTETTIEYSIEKPCTNIILKVFAAMGQIIFTQNMGDLPPGKYQYLFKQGISSGAYYYTISSDEGTITRKMLKVK